MTSRAQKASDAEAKARAGSFSEAIGQMPIDDLRVYSLFRLAATPDATHWMGPAQWMALAPEERRQLAGLAEGEAPDTPPRLGPMPGAISTPAGPVLSAAVAREIDKGDTSHLALSSLSAPDQAPSCPKCHGTRVPSGAQDRHQGGVRAELVVGLLVGVWGGALAPLTTSRA